MQTVSQDNAFNTTIMASFDAHLDLALKQAML